MDLKEEINRLKIEKGAVILAHYYQRNEIQDIADYIGDSLALAQYATKCDAQILVICGVNFMGETAKILSPNKKVLIPDLTAGCSLADSCKAEDLKALKDKYPHHTVVSYVNTTAQVKALTDIVVTSSNAKHIIDTLPQDEKIIFCPDRNLGGYINSVTGRDMLVWDGACHVHEQFSLEKILKLKEENPTAQIVAHPECKSPILKVADKIGSTLALLKYVQQSPKTEFIVATEWGILHQMQQTCPDKKFIPAPPNDSTCACNECSYMKQSTLQNLYETLLEEKNEVFVDESLIERAAAPIVKMLKLSENIKI